MKKFNAEFDERTKEQKKQKKLASQTQESIIMLNNQQEAARRQQQDERRKTIKNTKTAKQISTEKDATALLLQIDNIVISDWRSDMNFPVYICCSVKHRGLCLYRHVKWQSRRKLEALTFLMQEGKIKFCKNALVLVRKQEKPFTPYPKNFDLTLGREPVS